ncbi:MAG TPA: hypothetical protein VEU74_08640 [Gemmatimonadales bacterium]|nr:hypothetical protein [Gemmatimonadales bacterium]
MTLAWPPRTAAPEEPAPLVWYHPVHADHQQIQQWLCSHFAPGPVHLRQIDGAYYQYQAERQRGDALTVRYTLEITQDAFDHEPVADITRRLEEQNVAELLLADPLLRLRYVRGGGIEPQR